MACSLIPAACWSGHRLSRASDGSLGNRRLLSDPVSCSSGASWRALRSWRPKILRAHPRGWWSSLELGGMGLTSSSWPWSHPTHLWTCSGCSCPQSGKQRDRLKRAITEGALMCLGSLPEAQDPAPSSVSPLPSALLHCPHHHLSCCQEVCCLLSTYSHSLRDPGDNPRGDTPLICADGIRILGHGPLQHGPGSPLPTGTRLVRQKLKTALLSLRCV